MSKVKYKALNGKRNFEKTLAGFRLITVTINPTNIKYSTCYFVKQKEK